MRGRTPRGRQKQTQWVAVSDVEVNVPPGYDFLSARQNTTALEIQVRAQLKPDNCPICGAKLDPYSSRHPSFRDVKQSERTCVLFVHRRQYMCQGSLHHFVGQPLPGIDVKHDMTVRLVQYIRNNPDLTNVKLAASVGVSDKTVAGIHLDYAAEIGKRQKSCERYLALGFDEKHIDGVNHFVLVDLVTGTYITMISGNDRETIRRELEQYAHRDQVGLITIDMHNDYSDLAKELFPKASVIYDAFHILDLVDACRESVRIDAGRLATGDAKAMLRDRKHFWSRLSDPAWEGTQCDLFSEIPSVMEAHNTYMTFLNFWQLAHDPREASRLFDFWVERIPLGVRPYFESFIQAIEKRRDEVFQYFATGATAGPTEAVNRNIAAELYKGRGYSEQGLAARMKVKGEVKRLRQVDAQKEEGELCDGIMGQREVQLSTAGSLARSEKMRNRVSTARASSQALAAAQSDTHVGCPDGVDTVPEEPERSTPEVMPPADNWAHHSSIISTLLPSEAAVPRVSIRYYCLLCTAWDAESQGCTNRGSDCRTNEE
jgi:transposase